MKDPSFLGRMAAWVRSRSQRAGFEAEQTPPNGEQDKIRKDVLALQALIRTQGGRLNTIDQRSVHTKDQVQKHQQPEESKQAIVSSWLEAAGPADRTQAVEQLVNRHDNLKGKYASTNTFRTKQGWPNSFFVRKDSVICVRSSDPQIAARSRPTPPLCNSNFLTRLRGGPSGSPFGVLSTVIGPAGALTFGAAEVAFGDTGSAWVAFGGVFRIGGALAGVLAGTFGGFFGANGASAFQRQNMTKPKSPTMLLKPRKVNSKRHIHPNGSSAAARREPREGQTATSHKTFSPFTSRHPPSRQQQPLTHSTPHCSTSGSKPTPKMRTMRWTEVFLT